MVHVSSIVCTSESVHCELSQCLSKKVVLLVEKRFRLLRICEEDTPFPTSVSTIWQAHQRSVPFSQHFLALIVETHRKHHLTDCQSHGDQLGPSTMSAVIMKKKQDLPNVNVQRTVRRGKAHRCDEQSQTHTLHPSALTRCVCMTHRSRQSSHCGQTKKKGGETSELLQAFLRPICVVLDVVLRQAYEHHSQ